MTGYFNFILLLVLPLVLSCSKNSDSSSSTTAAVFTINGNVPAGSLAYNFTDGKIIPEALNITHVMAVNPSSANAKRVLATLDSSGKYALPVDGNRPWILVYIDSTKTGANMVQGIFRSSTLDSITPEKTSGSIDLGSSSFSNGVASIGLAYADLLSGLGLSTDVASFLGSVDDLCLRYVNPDIDGDGTIDALQSNRNFMFDFHVRYNQKNSGSTNATISDIIGKFLGNTTSITYTGTGIYISYDTSFSSSDPTTGSVTFPGTLFYQASGGGTTSGTSISGANLSTLSYGGNGRSFGVGVTDTSNNIPSGTYTATIGGKTLTFTNVQTRANADLVAAKNVIAPFVSVVPVVSGCTSSCAIASIDYKWKKRTSDGTAWVDATLEEIALMVSDSGAFVSIRYNKDNASDTSVGITIPMTAVSGSLAWNTTNARISGISESTFNSMTTNQLCHFGLSYDDKIGMRMFWGIENAAGTCS